VNQRQHYSIRSDATYVDFSMNIFSEHVIERTDLPKQLIKDVSGEYILDQTQPKVGYILQLAYLLLIV